MSKLTKEINKISLAVIGISGRLVFYALVLVLLVLGVRKTYEFGHDIFSPRMEALRGRKRL
ncbi:MAG: hypothetical protein ACLR9Z_11585 [Alitiscatomonas sp.]